jgi:TRAP-type mannitol/chloroaromatic compound transport system permease large subunit
LIVYGATAGVSVVQLYAGAFFPGIMLTTLYLGYVILRAKLNPALAPPLSAEERRVPLPEFAQRIADSITRCALPGLMAALKGRRNAGVPARQLVGQLLIVLLPALVWFTAIGLVYRTVTAPLEIVDTGGLIEMGGAIAPSAGGVAEPPGAESVTEPRAEGVQEPPGVTSDKAAMPADTLAPPPGAGETTTPAARAAPTGFWMTFGIGTVLLALFYWRFTFTRLEVFKMLLGSFFPLAILILAVLGSIVFGLATPTEAAAVGAFGGFILAAAYRQLNFGMIKESVFLTAKTSAMVCWLFVGSSIFSAAFALLGGQELIEKWVLSLNMSPVQFMLLAQFIIFLLGWPLEWTEIIIIFMPIFIPLLQHFHIDPLFFGLMVALNLQTAFLSPPVAMAAFYLKGVAPPHVTLNQIFAGMMPFMAIQVLAMFLLYMFPQIGLWLPQAIYK